MSSAESAKRRLKQLIVSFMEKQPGQELAGGDARVVMQAMEQDEVMAEVTKCLEEMGAKSENSRKYKLRTAINEKLEYVGYTIRVKRPMPKHQPTDRLSELLTQHA